MIATLVHPGPVEAARWAAVPCRAEPVEVILPVADTLARSTALALADFDGGWLEIEDAAMEALDFVIPGTDPSGAHAAWYAGPFRMGGGRVLRMGMHVGCKDGRPWLHGHGSFAAPGWQGPGFGHILPIESRLAAPVHASGWGLRGARLQVATDPETRFPLFQPVSRPGAPDGGQRAALITLRPNQDLGLSLARAAAAAGIDCGRVVGLGSLVHPRLVDQPAIDSFATEILLAGATLDHGAARIGADLVTLSGQHHAGLLQPGENGICITAEVLVIADR